MSRGFDSTGTGSDTTSVPMKRVYGWKPDLKDMRDRYFAAPPRVLAQLPEKIDMRPQCPPIVDQGNLGSCTANAIGNAHRFEQMRQGSPGNFLPSRLFIYYNERALEGTVGSDAGASIRDGIKTIVDKGVCPETTWPYLISKFTQKPPTTAYTEAMLHQAVKYQRVTQTIDQIKAALASGHTIVFGFSVYESFEAVWPSTGMMPLPRAGEQMLGGHATTIVGYDDAMARAIVMNSWGNTWGDRGYFYMPYQFVINPSMCSDFWMLSEVEITDVPGPTPPTPPTPGPSNIYRSVLVNGVASGLMVPAGSQITLG